MQQSEYKKLWQPYLCATARTQSQYPVRVTNRPSAVNSLFKQNVNNLNNNMQIIANKNSEPKSKNPNNFSDSISCSNHFYTKCRASMEFCQNFMLVVFHINCQNLAAQWICHSSSIKANFFWHLWKPTECKYAVETAKKWHLAGFFQQVSSNATLSFMMLSSSEERQKRLEN